MATRRVLRVSGRRAFDALRTGARGRQGPVRVTYVPAGDEVRVALAVARREAGGAVVRNRIRRRLRAAAAEAGLAPGTYLVQAAAPAAGAPWADLVRDVRVAAGAAVERSTGR